MKRSLLFRILDHSSSPSAWIRIRIELPWLDSDPHQTFLAGSGSALKEGGAGTSMQDISDIKINIRRKVDMSSSYNDTKNRSVEPDQ